VPRQLRARRLNNHAKVPARERESRGTPDVGEGDGVAFDIIMIRTEAVTEIPLRFYSFHLRF
jgi:hypothetical protein